MTLELFGTLFVLALVDSTSVGTLIIPILFLLAPGRLRVGRLLTYLATIAIFYFIVGVIVQAGAGALFEALGEVIESTTAYIVQLALGLLLLALGAWIGFTKPKNPDRPGRITAWRDRALADGARPTAIVGLALVAGVIELATMLPYLGAIGLLTTSELQLPARLLTLALYCAVMVLPALALLVRRIVAATRIEPALARFAAWMQRNARENTAWVVGIVGFLLVRDAASYLGALEGLTNLIDDMNI